MNEISHTTCSERLEGYALGTLEARARAEVARHLEACPDCSLELKGVEALKQHEVLPLSGVERDRLSTAVRTAVFEASKPSLRDRFGRRFAPALGAVAFLALAAVAFVSLPDRTDHPTTANQESSDREGDTADSSGGDVVDADRAVPEAKAKEETLSDEGAGGGSGQTTGGAPAQESSEMAASAGTALAARANFTVQETPFAQAGLDPGALVPVISPGATIDAYDAGPVGIANSAPNRRLGRLTRECTENTLATSPHPLVPTSAAYYPDGVLVVGFVWLEESSSLLNYELRGWTGGRCDRISPIYRRGTLE